MQVQGVFSFIFILGFLILNIGIMSFITRRNFIKRCEKAQGIVVDIVERIIRRDGRRRRYYYPVVEFKASNGNIIKFTSETGGYKSGLTGSSSFQTVGQQIEVLYDPQNPNKVYINTFFGVWGASFILVIMGILFSVISLIQLLTIFFLN